MSRPILSDGSEKRISDRRGYLTDQKRGVDRARRVGSGEVRGGIRRSVDEGKGVAGGGGKRNETRSRAAVYGQHSAGDIGAVEP